MFSLGFGSSKSRTDSTSRSVSQSIQGSQGTASSISGGASTAASSQEVFMADLFSQLYGGAAGAAGGISTAGITDAANQLFNQGSGFLTSLMGQAAGTDTAGQYMTDRVTGDDGVLNEQIAALEADIGRLFSEQLMPGITSQAVGGGQLGGGRQGVAEGMAMREAASQFTQGATQLRAADQAARDATAANLAQIQGQAAVSGIAALPGLFGLQEAGAMATMSPYMSLAQIMGSPTTLSDSLAQSWQFGQGSSQQSSFGEAASFSTAQSKSRSNALNMSVGFGGGGS